MRRIIAGSVVLLLVVVLALAQLLLPGIAASMLRDRLAKSGRVESVQVSAFPAIELLWHHASKVVIRMSSYRSSEGHLTSLLDQLGDVGTVRASISRFNSGLLDLEDATLSKNGNEVTGTARITEAALRSAVPFLESVVPVSAGAGGLTLRGTAGLFGLSATADATVAARDGRIVVTPDVPIFDLANLTVFSDPHLYVQGVSGGSVPGGLSLSARAQVR